MASAAGDFAGKRGARLVTALVFVTALFFIWALVTNLIDRLVKSMKVIYTHSDFETQLNQFAFFIAYGVMSIPAACYLSRRGYANAIVLGLVGVLAGCLIASMGDQKGSHFRLNLSQAFNSLGAYVGGIFCAAYLLKGDLLVKDVVLTDALKSEGLSFVTGVYLLIAAALVVFIGAVPLVRRTIAAHAPVLPDTVESPLSALGSRWANLGALAIFLYVGAEVCVISGMIFFLEQLQILNSPSQTAGYVAPIFMLLAMVGWFGGSVLLRRISATTMLAFVAAGASLLCLIVMATYANSATPLSGSMTLPGGYVAPLTTGFVPAAAAADRKRD